MSLRTASLFLVAIFCFSLKLRAADQPQFKIIRGTVLNLDGRPAANREVLLVGLSRGSTQYYSDEPANDPAWNFKTDKVGHFEVRLGEFKSWDDQQHRPGWGIYGLVVSRGKHDAGAVSPYLSNSKTPFTRDRPSNEWGTLVDVPHEDLNITLQIKQGVTLKGRVVDYSDPTKPLAGVDIFTNNDLYSESHSGHGGEILLQNATTDSNGNFTLTQIYPVLFFVGVGCERGFTENAGDATWLKTKVDGIWKDDVVDVITPPKDGAVMNLEIMAAPKPLFRCFGRVISSSGRPVADAKMSFGVSFHPEETTFSDSHTFLHTATKADGTYEIFLSTPWIRGAAIEHDDAARLDDWASPNGASFFPPGQYDFVLKPK